MHNTLEAAKVFSTISSIPPSPPRGGAMHDYILYVQQMPRRYPGKPIPSDM